MTNEVIEHFERINNNTNSVLLTKELFDEFDAIQRNRSKLDTFYYEYVLYNLDESPDMPYQIAIIKIDKKEQSAQLTYTNRETGTIETVNGSLMFLEVSNHIMFSFHKGGFVLDVLCYYVRTTDFIQAVYLHTDTGGRPRTSFGIIEKQDLTSPKTPSRDPSAMPSEIRNFLMHQFKDTPQIKSDFVDRTALNVGLTKNYHLARKYEGTWYLYYNVRLSRIQNYRENPVVSEIAQSVLSISVDEFSGKITCSMDAHDGRKFEGELMFNRHLKNSSTVLGILLHDEEGEERVLSFIFDTNHGYDDNKDKGRKDTLRGTYNITYANQKQGCGLAIMKWAGVNIIGKARMIDPLGEDRSKMKLSVQYMALKKTGLIVPDDLQPKPDIKKYVGTYVMYNYGIKIENEIEKWAVLRSALVITDFGLVIFKGLKGVNAFGFAQIHKGNMYIELQSTTQTNRIGYCILYVGEDRELEEGAILTGIFTGITINDYIPIGKRIILERTNKEYDAITPDKFLTLEDKEENIPESIRKVLAGNLKNMIGFLKKRNKIFRKDKLGDEIDSTQRLGKSFCEAACFKIWDAVQQGGTADFQNSVVEALKLLSRALSHGFTEINLFEKSINKIDVEAYQKIIENEEFKRLKLVAENLSKRTN